MCNSARAGPSLIRYGNNRAAVTSPWRIMILRVRLVPEKWFPTIIGQAGSYAAVLLLWSRTRTCCTVVIMTPSRVTVIVVICQVPLATRFKLFTRAFLTQVPNVSCHRD